MQSGADENYCSASTDFIPNDVGLGGTAERMILLTGPNVRRAD